MQQSQRSPLALDRVKINIESQQVVWLGEPVVSLEKLRNTIDYTKIFTNIDECIHYIENSQDLITFLVCSQELGSIIIPQIYDFKNVKAIYIFDYEKKDTDRSEKTSSLISLLQVKQPVYTNFEQLLHDLYRTVAQTNHRLFQGSLDLELLDDVGQSTDNPLFSWSFLVDFWIYLPYPETSRQRFSDTLKAYYDGHESKLKVLQEFERNYTSENAIQWYTRDTFLYSALNRALRQRNIELLFLYGFFLQDLHRQLEYKQNEQNNLQVFTCYRGQLMSHEEVQKLCKNVDFLKGTTFINNSLFSTTFNRDLALFYLNTELNRDDALQSVLFEIEIDRSKMQFSRPFADIANLSHFESESEVLFMMGTSFLIFTKDIYYSEDEKVWLIKAQLYERNKIEDITLDNNDFTTMNKRINLRRCFILLLQAVRRANSLADRQLDVIFHELVLMYPSESDWLSAVHLQCLAKYQCSTLNTYSLAHSNYEHALQLWSKYSDDEELNCYDQIAQIHYSIAKMYKDHHRYGSSLALKHYNLAITNCEKALLNGILNNYEKLKLYMRLADIYDDKMTIENANNSHEDGLMSLKYLELYAAESRIISIVLLSKIGKVSTAIHDYDKAVSAYQKALEQLPTLVEPEKIIINCSIHFCELLVEIYIEQKQDYNLALKYQLLQHEYLQKVGLEDNVEMKRERKQQFAGCFMTLSAIYSHLNDNGLSYENLLTAIDLFKEMKTDNFNVDEVLAYAEQQLLSYELD